MSDPTILSFPVRQPSRVTIKIHIDPTFTGPFTVVASPDTLSFPLGEDGPKDVTLNLVDGQNNLVGPAIIHAVTSSDPAILSATFVGNVVSCAVVSRDQTDPLDITVDIDAE